MSGAGCCKKKMARATDVVENAKGAARQLKSGWPIAKPIPCQGRSRHVPVVKLAARAFLGPFFLNSKLSTWTLSKRWARRLWEWFSAFSRAGRERYESGSVQALTSDDEYKRFRQWKSESNGCSFCSGSWVMVCFIHLESMKSGHPHISISKQNFGEAFLGWDRYMIAQAGFGLIEDCRAECFVYSKAISSNMP